MSACGGMCFHQHLQTHKKTGASKAWVSRSKCEGGALSARARTEATKYIEHCVCVCVGGDSEDKEMEKQRRSRRNAHVHTCNSARSVRCAFAIASTWPGETPIKRMNEKHAPPLSSGGPPSVRSGGRDEWWTCSAVKMPRRERHNHGTYLGQELSVCVCVRVCVCVCVCCCCGCCCCCCCCCVHKKCCYGSNIFCFRSRQQICNTRTDALVIRKRRTAR